MWDDRKSLVLSKCSVVFFMVLLAGCAVYAPSGFRVWFARTQEGAKAYFLATVYLGCIPAAALLALLYTLLHRIGGGQLFVTKNTDCLRHISWCCFAGAAVSLASSLYWIPWLAVGIAAAFMGLIVRVIKNLVAKAVSLQDDADFTI